MYAYTDETGRILATTDREEYAGGMQEFEFPEDFDFTKQDEYHIVDGELTHDPLPPSEDEQATQVQALKASQLETAAAMYVKAAKLPRMDAISVCTLYDEWSGKGIKYTKGQWLRYGDDFAYVEQDHTSQPDWTPEAAPSLYTVFKLAPDGIRIWEQPTRAENAFDTGEKCHYPDADGEVWASKIDGNTTVPGSDDRWWEKSDAGTE